MRNVAKKGILTAVATGSVLASTAGYAYAGAEAQGGAVGSPGVASGNSVQVPVDVPINACGNTADVIGALNPAFGNRCANSDRRGGSGHAAHTASGSSASGTAAGSPGVASGNSVQAPVHIPVNACGNSVDVVGVGNPAFGNGCGNEGSPVATPPAKPDDDCPEGHGSHNPPPPGTGQPSTPPQTGGETPPGNPRTGNPSTTIPGAPTGAGTVATPSTGAPAAPTAGGGQSGQGGQGGQAVPAAARQANDTAAGGQAATGSQLASTGAGSTELMGAAGLALLLGGGVLYRRARAGAR
ncbi:chaplin family protein [Kitasatospora sp. NPDC058170]|uniref:chaplin n=1 Tax=Kitasatospora sp. NPDC058170 TaxID=3346364 RepID=UPI0036DF166F